MPPFLHQDVINRSRLKDLYVILLLFCVVSHCEGGMYIGNF